MPLELSQRSGKVVFCIGYCQSIRLRDGHVFPVQPFSKAELFVPGGWVACRGDWHGPRYFLANDIMARPVPLETWMLIPMQYAIRAIDLCAAASVNLGRDGFSRIPFP